MKRTFFFRFFSAILVVSAVCCFLAGFEEAPKHQSEQELIDSYVRNWHITGSYTEAAKYTGLLDFSNAAPLDITLEGTFGLSDSDGNIITSE